MRGLSRILVLLATLLAAVGLAAASAATPQITGTTLANRASLPPGDGPWVVLAYYSDPALPRQLASRVEPWEVHPEQGYLVAEVDRETYEWMLSAGFRLEVDAKLTRQAQQPLIPLPGQANGVPAYPCYHTVEETYAAAEQIAAGHPYLATWEDIGDSWEKRDPGGLPGYDLRVLHLTNSVNPGPKPGLFIMSSVHAREYAPAELNLRFAEYLAENYGIDPEATWILDYTDIYLLFQSNPDGRKQAEGGLSWRKNTDNLYCSNSASRGVDLNRNFSYAWGCCGGSSGSTCNEVYRGPSAASEPETQAIQNYVRQHFPDQRGVGPDSPAPADATGIFLDLHSYGGLVLWPWGFTSQAAPNATALQTLGRKLAFFNGYSPEQSYLLYTTDGTTDDFAYGELGLAAYTVEMGNAFFQDCATFEGSIVSQNMPALLFAARTARSPYLSPAGPEVLELSITPQTGAPGADLQVSARVDDTRFNNSQGNEVVQAISAAEYSIDTPPWQAGATQAMSAADGSFNQSSESVSATINTSGLEQGRHILFVRGRDAAGNWGPPSATFFYLLTPSGSPAVQGFLRQVLTGMPLEGIVQAGPFTAASDPATGFYSTHLLPGSYTLSASAPGHLISTTQVLATDTQLVSQDFNLYPICQIINDNVENGNTGWTATTPWGISNEAAHSPAHAWTDSPGGYYANNINVSLTSPVLDLSGYSGVSLSFWHTYDLEAGYDYARVEYSTDDGNTWSEAAAYSEEAHNAWTQTSLALPALDGASQARLRFRLTSDFIKNGEGWHIDDIVLSGGNLNCLPQLAPSAGFTASQPPLASRPVTFTNLSYGTPPLSFAWDFGDGSPVSSLAQPSHIYATAGTYAVRLTASSALGSNTISQALVVGPPPAVFLALVIK
jgi:carboxypeptidase T